MASTDLTLKTTVKGASKSASELGKINKKLDQTAKSAKKAAKAFVAFAGVIGVAAVVQAAKFEKSMANLSTLIAGDATDAIEDFEEGIKRLMQTIPVTAEDLGLSAYAIVSAGITDTSEALRILEASSKLAVAGLGTTEEATTLMVLAANNFRDSTLTAAEKAEVLFKTVQAGITTVGELSQSFGLVAPLAVEAGISFEELQAVTAALTQVNKSASISQNAIKASLISLGKPTQDAMDLFNTLGVKTFPELIEQSGGYVGALDALKKASGENVQQFNRAIGSGEALSAVNAILGEQSDAVTEAFDNMTVASGALEEAFQKQIETTDAQWKILKNNLNVALMELGQNIIPPLLEGLTEFNSLMLTIKQTGEIADGSLESSKEGFEGLKGAISRTTGTNQEFLEKVSEVTGESIRAYKALEQGLTQDFTRIIGKHDESKENLRVWLAANIDSLDQSALAYATFSEEAILQIASIDTELAKSIKEKRSQGTQIMSELIEGIEAEKGRLNVLVASIASIINRITNSSRVVSGAGGLSVPQLAHGGPLGAGQTAIVGEEGPELFTPKVSGNITPNNKLGGTTVILNGVFGSDAAEEIGDMIVERLQLASAI